MKKFRTKLLLMFGILFFVIEGIIGVTEIISTINTNNEQIIAYEQDLMQQYDANIKSQTESAITLLHYAYSQYQSGELTEQQAQQLGHTLIKQLRYGESGYFWIDRTDGVLMAHPEIPQNEGQNRIDIQDPEGTYLIKNIIEAATTNENDGFTEYMWEKPDVEGHDIIVGLVGASADLNHTIDISEGKTIKGAVHMNDFENLLLGDVANLEFSLDGGDEWCDYVSGNEDSINTSNVTGIRFEGNQTVKLRYKANGTQLQSAETEYNFTENTDTENKKYVPLKNVKFVEASAHQSGRNPETFINGIGSDGYHTVFGTTTKDKFYTVEFDKPRYISSIDYVVNGGNNGRLKTGEIQVSMDGQEWTTVKTISNNPRDKYSVTFDFDTVAKAKYLKIVAAETHGNQPGETNMYLSGSELRFYEDTTIVEDEPTILPDDVPVDSDDIPIVDIPKNPETEGGNDNAGDVLPPEEVKPTPPTNEDGSNKGEEVTPTPPTNEDGSNKGEEVTPTPPTNEDGADKEEEEEVMPVPPTNGIEGLDKLDKELQEKVDSIIADTVIDNKGLTLNITGDNSYIKQVTTLEVTKDGIFAIVDGEKLKFGVALDGLDIDLTNARVVRINPERNSIGSYSAVPYRVTKDGLKIYSNNMENLLITTKVSEPFKDVNDTDWFKADVEEIYNYGFTQGTTATTYSPNNEITRGEFAVMIARALELTVRSGATEFKDTEDKWYANEVQALKDASIVSGFGDGTFDGDKTITRQEATKMLLNMLEYAKVDTTTKSQVNLVDMDKVSDFAKHSVQFLAEKGVLVGDGNKKFNPTNNLTRAEMAKILVKALKLTDLY